MMRILPALLLLGCAKSATPPADAPADAVIEAPAPPGFEGAPAGAAGIASLLRARHVDDLPGRETLDKHPEPVASLAWLTSNASTAMVKVRAVRALGTHYPTEEADLIGGLAATAPAPLRAAALRALGDWPAQAREPYVGAVVAGLGDDDPRVALGAVAAAHGLESAETALSEAATGHPVVEVREAAAGR